MTLQRVGDREQGGVAPQGLRAMPAVRVGIAEDHPITRAALRSFLDEQDDIRVVAEAASGREAIDLVRTQQVDVLLLDLGMPGQSGIDALTMIKAKAEHVAVLVLSAYPERQYAVPLIRSGASGYLNKSCELPEICAAIRRVAQGGRYITPVVAELLATQVIAATPGSLHEQLSARELQVFLKLAQGCTAAQVAAELSLSAKTVSTYRARLMRKLDARSNSDLTYYALKHRLLD